MIDLEIALYESLAPLISRQLSASPGCGLLKTKPFNT